ncbi:hypothetical protein F4803DRAFT_544317 [Xylaria telfairii]|nr:hypothetical protein F4803DRAFT_544317 [Xylaria telfairii]
MNIPVDGLKWEFRDLKGLVAVFLLGGARGRECWLCVGRYDGTVDTLVSNRSVSLHPEFIYNTHTFLKHANKYIFF